MVPREAFRPLLSEKGHTFRAFQDASIGASAYQIRLMDVLDGVYRALQCGFFNFSDFDLTEYEYYDNIEHGDLNWILPSKFLAFCGPSSEHLTVYKPPEFYLPYFKRNSISTVIRLNKKAYDARVFIDAGIQHFDLYFMDGGVPSQMIAEKFLKITEAAKGAVAVHCKAGLGRTGSLIGAYLMKHYRMTAQEAIAWLRICRPGSVIGRQQTWLEDMEYWLWKCGEAYRIQHHGDGDKIPRHAFGIYSIKAKLIANRKPVANGSDIVLPKGVGFLKYLLEEETQDKEDATSTFYAASDIKPICKKTKLNRRRDFKIPYSQSSPRSEVKAQSLIVKSCPSKKFPVEKHEEVLSGNKRIVQTNKKEKKSLSICNKKEKETKEVKESKEELTQGDHLNMIKTMRSRVTRQLQKHDMKQPIKGNK
ncbi:Dual specificity protein phosphatase CDC14A [Gryllus bimaculatus]|nr:Dual specificity protein phosphatase CDC14A [Gryllus bimaculatus]